VSRGSRRYELRVLVAQTDDCRRRKAVQNPAYSGRDVLVFEDFRSGADCRRF